MKYYPILLIIFTQVSGCASYYASKSDYNEIINKWLSNNEYTKIQQSLKKLSKNHPDYKIISARKNELKLKEKKYIENSLVSAKKQLKQEKWQSALNVYETALEKVEDNKELLTAKDELIKERNTQVTELRKNMLLRRAKALVQYKPIYTKLKKLIPNDYSARYDINKFEDEKNEASRQLMDCGNQALTQKNYNLAEECFELSNKLIPLKDTQTLISKTKHIINRNDNKKKTHDLINAYHQAYEAGNFPKARLHLDQLLIINPEHKKSQQLKQQLDRDINTRIEKGINLGKTQYSQGKINEALKTWQDSSKLDPKNEELSALINRAKKVSSKIEQLEKAPGN
jgi:tetratricopeptide (TPR) repeat protein